MGAVRLTVGQSPNWLIRFNSIKYWLLRHVCDKTNYSGRTAQFK